MERWSSMTAVSIPGPLSSTDGSTSRLRAPGADHHAAVPLPRALIPSLIAFSTSGWRSIVGRKCDKRVGFDIALNLDAPRRSGSSRYRGSPPRTPVAARRDERRVGSGEAGEAPPPRPGWMREVTVLTCWKRKCGFTWFRSAARRASARSPCVRRMCASIRGVS